MTIENQVPRARGLIRAAITPLAASVLESLAVRSFTIFVAAALAYWAARPALLHPQSVTESVTIIALLTAFSALGAKARAADLQRLPRFMLTATSLLIGAVALFHTPQYMLGGEHDAAYIWARILGILCAAAAAIAVWRPAFSVITFAGFYHLDRMTIEVYGGLTRTILDWITIAEVMLFLAMIVTSHSAMQRFRWYRRITSGEDSGFRFMELIALFCVAVHFGNYFYSGYAKVVLDGGPLSWLLENPTYNNFVFIVYNGLFPISLADGSFGPALFSALQDSNVLINIAVLGSQLLAIVCVLRPLWARIISVVYDFFHVGVFILGGILFYKWIVLNVAIFTALRGAPARFSRPLMVCMAATLLGSTAIFTIAHLGWYNATVGHAIQITAIDRDGVQYEVPNNYWMARAFEIRSGRFKDAFNGTIPETTSGGTMSYEFMRRSMSCDVATNGAPKEHSRHSRDALIRTIRQHHAYVLANLDENGHINYDLYPHHTWSDFLTERYAPFRELDKRTIVSYRVTMKAACFHGFDDDGHPNVRVLAQDSLEVRP